LALYTWDGGQEFKGKAWNHDEFPSDALLIMSLFTNFMDSKLNYGFSVKYICKSNIKTKSQVLRIRQISKFPLHYNLIIADKIYDVVRGRSNVVKTLCLWVSHHARMGGYVQMLYLGGKGNLKSY
jgi:hypothetical protein